MRDPMLSPYPFYSILGAILLGMALYALAVQRHILRKVLAWNILGSGLFLILGALGQRNATGSIVDPLPQAVVITGIVVSISATALALIIAQRLHHMRSRKHDPADSSPAKKQDCHAE